MTYVRVACVCLSETFQHFLEIIVVISKAATVLRNFNFFLLVM